MFQHAVVAAIIQAQLKMAITSFNVFNPSMMAFAQKGIYPNLYKNFGQYEFKWTKTKNDFELIDLEVETTSVFLGGGKLNEVSIDEDYMVVSASTTDQKQT